MAESLRFSVTVVVNRTLLLLRAVVPGQFQQSLPFRDGIPDPLLDLGVGCRVTQEVQVELVVRVLGGADQGHAHGFLVELQAGLGILDPQHGMVEAIATGVGGGRQILVAAADDLHPVPIGVLGEGNVPHATLGKLLLEGVAGILDALAGGLDVVDGDGEVTESTVGLGIAIYHAVVGIILGAVVVRELQHRIPVGKVAVAALQRGRATVGEEVVGELPFGEIHLLDQLETEKVIELNRSLWVLDPQHRICANMESDLMWADGDGTHG